MPFTPSPHIPQQWHDAPLTDTPLDAAHLDAAEVDLVNYIQAVIESYDSYALALFAPLASPALSGTPTAPTPGGSDSSTRLATTAFTQGLFAQALLKANNLSDVANNDTARANLSVPTLRHAQCVATANVALSGTLPTIDGYAVQDGDRVLLTGQTTASQNGPWIAHAAGWVRPNDFPALAVLTSRSMKVTGGSTYAKTDWVLASTASITVDTGAQTWSLVGRAAGNGLTLTGNTLSVNPGTGLAISGGQVVVSYGTAAGTAAQGNDSRITGALQAANSLSDVASAATARTNLGLSAAGGDLAGTYPNPTLSTTGLNKLLQLASAANVKLAFGSFTVAVSVGWGTITANGPSWPSNHYMFWYSIRPPTGASITSSELGATLAAGVNQTIDVNSSVAQTITVYWASLGN